VDHLARKKAFKLGKLPILEKEYTDPEKTQLRKFFDSLDVSPIQLKEGKSLENI